MPRHSRRRRSSYDGVFGLLLGALGVVALIGLGAGAYFYRLSRPDLDAQNCPRSGPIAYHTIVIDRSDPITEFQAQGIRQRLKTSLTAVATGTKVEIYVFQGDATTVSKPELSVCAPAHPDTANELYENKKRRRQNYEQNFEQAVARVIEDLLKAKSEPNSPIIEGIRSVAQTAYSADMQRPKKMILVSDMVQHTGLFSQFKSDVSFDTLEKQPGWPQLRPNLRGAQIEVIYLLRPNAKRGGVAIQSRGHQAFWEKLVAASNGDLIAMEPL